MYHVVCLGLFTVVSAMFLHVPHVLGSQVRVNFAVPSFEVLRSCVFASSY